MDESWRRGIGYVRISELGVGFGEPRLLMNSAHRLPTGFTTLNGPE